MMARALGSAGDRLNAIIGTRTNPNAATTDDS
jgi:hypothetical protein